jgi:hypothetical protein
MRRTHRLLIDTRRSRSLRPGQIYDGVICPTCGMPTVFIGARPLLVKCSDCETEIDVDLEEVERFRAEYLN